MKRHLLAGLLASTLLATAAPALADDGAACLDAASRGQSLRDAHQLVEARDQFRLCARRQCPATAQRECVGWLGDVQRELPTVVVTAKDAHGVDLQSVEVSLDGQALLTRLDGQAVPVNPGQHVFHFRAADGTEGEQRAPIKAGKKNQAVAVVLAKLVVTTPASAPPRVAENGDAPTEPAGPWGTVGWVLGGVGVVGLGAGAAFGVKAIGDKNAHCDSNNLCDDGSLGGLKTAALLSDIGLMAGAALVVTGTALILFAPGGAHGSSASLRIAPAWTAGGGGIAARGIW